MGRITVVGLGPAGPELMTRQALDAVAAIPARFVRTTRHPAAGAIPDAVSFDRLYEESHTLEQVYASIVEELVAAAASEPHVLYAVPGSPAVAERTVELLRADPAVEIAVLPALSCVDLAWARLGVDPLAAGARIVDGHRFEVEAVGERGPLLVLQCDRPEVLSAIKLSTDDGGTVTVLHHLGLPDERIAEVAWADLDRVRPDHLTSLWVPFVAEPVGRELVRFAELVRTLRHGCPWDRAQTHSSLRPFVVEEAYEVLDAIDSGDVDHLEEELGDLLFQVVFHATLAAEEGAFTLTDVARGIHDKLVRRHPHVFGGPGGPADWERLKREEKGPHGAMDRIPETLPSLVLAQKIQQRAAAVGFDWDDVEGAWPKVAEEIEEVRAATGERVEHEIGDLLFACVNVARHLGVDAEVALRGASRKFQGRFRALERIADERGIDVEQAGLAVLDALWDEVKSAGG